MLKGEWWRAVTALCLHYQRRAPSRQSCIRHGLSHAPVPGHWRWCRSPCNDHRWCGGQCSQRSCAVTGVLFDWRLHGDICRPRPARRIAAGGAPRLRNLRSEQLDAAGWWLGIAGIPRPQRGEYGHPCPCAGLWVGCCRGFGACKVGPRLDRRSGFAVDVRRHRRCGRGFRLGCGGFCLSCVEI